MASRDRFHFGLFLPWRISYLVRTWEATQCFATKGLWQALVAFCCVWGRLWKFWCCPRPFRAWIGCIFVSTGKVPGEPSRAEPKLCISSPQPYLLWTFCIGLVTIFLASCGLMDLQGAFGCGCPKVKGAPGRLLWILISGFWVAEAMVPLPALERGRAETRSGNNLLATRFARHDTLERHEKLPTDFRVWLHDQHKVYFSLPLTTEPPDAEEICKWLINCGQEMYLSEEAHRKSAETINAVSAARLVVRKPTDRRLGPGSRLVDGRAEWTSSCTPTVQFTGDACIGTDEGLERFQQPFVWFWPANNKGQWAPPFWPRIAPSWRCNPPFADDQGLRTGQAQRPMGNWNSDGDLFAEDLIYNLCWKTGLDNAS